MTTVRVAFVGKGGSGKSSIAGTVARLLAQRGEPVLVLDSDPMPGLAYALGVEPDDAGLPDDAVDDAPAGAPGPRYRLRLPPEEAAERYAAHGPDGVRVLQTAKLHGPAFSQIRGQHAFRQIVEGLDSDRWHVVADLPAGTRQPSFGWARNASLWLAVVEPTAASALSVRRLARLVGTTAGPERLAVVVNKVRHPDDVAVAAERTGLDVVGAVPWDEEVRAADHAGRAPVDHAADTAAVRAVAVLVDDLVSGRLGPVREGSQP